MKNTDYESIVTNFNQPILVLAGPGAGKTHLLADRVTRLIDKGVSEDSITVLTFGKDANLHMKAKLLNKEKGFGLVFNKLPNISTMHSLGFEILNRNLRYFNLKKDNLNVLENEDVKYLLYRDATLILGYNKDIGDVAYNCKIKGDCKVDLGKKECQICKKYWQIMAKCNYIDFDDQVLFACQLLENFPNLLNEYQQRAQHLLVDEYQDINSAQHRLIELLSRKSRNGLFVVGDDAQSIYGFRGSSPEFILRFDKDFTGAFITPLNHSRRCHQNIIKAAEFPLRKYYTSWTGPFELDYHIPLGDEPEIINVKSDLAEANLVTQISREALSEGKSVLVLVPKKSFFKRLSYNLRKHGIPHICPINLLPDWVNDRFQTIEHILNWVKDPEDNFKLRLAIETLSNNGIAKIPGGTITSKCKPETLENRLKINTEIASLWAKVDKNTFLLTVLTSSLNLSKELELIKTTLKGLNDSFHTYKGSLMGEFSKQLILSTGVWIQPENFVDDLNSMTDILHYIPPNGPNTVQMMTMRKAKGLEADVVIMIGLEDDIIPNPKSSLEEEARLFYVSMTRAKQKLYLIHSYTRPSYISYGPDLIGKKRSRFIDSLGKKSKFYGN